VAADREPPPTGPPLPAQPGPAAAAAGRGSRRAVETAAYAGLEPGFTKALRWPQGAQQKLKDLEQAWLGLTGRKASDARAGEQAGGRREAPGAAELPHFGRRPARPAKRQAGQVWEAPHPPQNPRSSTSSPASLPITTHRPASPCRPRTRHHSAPHPTPPARPRQPSPPPRRSTLRTRRPRRLSRVEQRAGSPRTRARRAAWRRSWREGSSWRGRGVRWLQRERITLMGVGGRGGELSSPDLGGRRNWAGGRWVAFRRPASRPPFRRLLLPRTASR